MNYLKKLFIEHYKGFVEKECVEFAVPNGSPGSGLTLVVGPNNTGKTTIIESLLIDTDKKFLESERHEGQPPKITIESSESKCGFTNIDGGSQIKYVEGTQAHNLKFELIPSRRHWSHISNSVAELKNYVSSSKEFKIRGAGTDNNTANLLKTIDKKKEEKEKLNNIIKQILPHFTNWTIDSDDHGDFVKYITFNREHKANLLGDGVISIFRIAAHLVDFNNDVLIIDEPELSIHPNVQKKLSTIFSESSKNKQIVLCTHSPYFVNWDDYINGSYFIRLNKIKDEKCTVLYLKHDKNYAKSIEGRLRDWHKPQLLDIVAKEIMFAEKILFLEGQEDVGLIKKWMKENNKNINCEVFGYGVGGWDSMELFLDIAKDLGIEKAGAIYDEGKDITEIKNKFQDYRIVQLPTKDIRDKSDKKIKGIFSENGILNQAYKQDFEDIMNSLISYFDS